MNNKGRNIWTEFIWIQYQINIFYSKLKLHPYSEKNQMKQPKSQLDQFLQYNLRGQQTESSSNYNSQWLAIYNKIKAQNSYKFMYSDIDSYVAKVNNLMANQINQPKILLKKSDHKSLLNELKLNFLKLVDDVNMLDLSSLAVCLEYVFDKLSDCLQTYFSNLYTCIQILNEQTTLNHSRYVFQSKCTQCQNGLLYNKIESMMNDMTLVDNNLNIKQMNKINRQINQLSSNYEDIQLSLLIDEILLRKQSILNCKNPRINNIYDQIAQYLENIPQSTINLNRENSNLHSCASVRVTPLSQLNIGNFSECNVFIQQMNRVRAQFHIITQGSNQKIYKANISICEIDIRKKEIIIVDINPSNDRFTKTLLLKDEQNIKMLLKNNEVLKKQLQLLRKIKRQSEKEMVKLLDSEQKNEIKLVELTTQNSFLIEKMDKISSELSLTKKKLQSTEANKKEMNQKIIKDYTTEKSIFLKTIRQMEIKIQTTTHQLTRLRKQTQSAMISCSVETDQSINCTVQVQTDDKSNLFQNYHANTLPNGEGEIRFSSNNQSRKNFINKFVNCMRKSDNNQVNSGETSPQMPILLEEDKIIGDGSRSENKKFDCKEEEQMRARVQKNGEETCKQINMLQEIGEREQNIKKKKRQSIIQKIDNIKQIESLSASNQLFMRGQRKKNTQTLTHINKGPFNKQQDTYSQFNLRIQQKLSKQMNRYLDFRQSDLKNLQINGIRSRSRNKLQSSRMFLKKQNCSPYIASYSSFANMQKNGEGWLEQLEINNMKREEGLQMLSKRESENREKIKFISRLMQRYKILKQTGLLSKINEIVSLNQLEDDEQKQQKQLNVLGQKRIKISERQQLKKKQAINENVKSKMKSQVRSIKIQTFSQNQLAILFVSPENAKKYELMKDIWKGLYNSIMLDYKFMNLCDQVQIYFTYLCQQYGIFYQQLCFFLDKPYQYVAEKKRNKKKIFQTPQKGEFNQNTRGNKNISKHNKQVSCVQVQKIVKADKKGLILSESENEEKKYLNAIITPHVIQNWERRKSPHQLRQIIHQILRYHKVIHRKCNHVQQFLSLIGFRNSY